MEKATKLESKVWAPPPNGEYYPTLIIGICNKCKRVMELDFHAGFNFRDGDKVMKRETILAFCEMCNEQTEFVPLPKEFQDSRNILGNLQNERLEDAGIARPD